MMLDDAPLVFGMGKGMCIDSDVDIGMTLGAAMSVSGLGLSMML